MKTQPLHLAAILLTAAAVLGADGAKRERGRLDEIQKMLSADVPRVLCLDEKFTTGGQPTGDAYVKAAANGFRAVLNLRTANEGVDLARERTRVESAKMRFFNIPVNSAAPRPEQADEFLRLTRDPANHPMLITCTSASRVGAFMMILRVVDQGWSEAEAIEEAKRIGLDSAVLKQFARNYIASHKARRR